MGPIVIAGDAALTGGKGIVVERRAYRMENPTCLIGDVRL